MNSLEQDIDKALFLIKQNKTMSELKKVYLNYFSSLYRFSTENIKEYYKFFDFTNKKYLTVTGSGDQTINALLKGCNDIECFDINPLAKYYQELKISAIKSLTYEEFLLFFVKNYSLYKSNKYVFNKSLYNKIKLTNDVKIFWDTLMKYNNISNTHLFNKDSLNFKSIININNYLNPKKYYKLQRLLNNNNYRIKYYDMNIKDLIKLEESYDIINLSNIASYLDTIYDKDRLKNFYELVKSLKVNKNGKIIVSYLYYYTENNDYLNEVGFFYKKFNGVEPKKRLLIKNISLLYDYILIYKNDKKV